MPPASGEEELWTEVAGMTLTDMIDRDHWSRDLFVDHGVVTALAHA